MIPNELKTNRKTNTNLFALLGWLHSSRSKKFEHFKIDVAQRCVGYVFGTRRRFCGSGFFARNSNQTNIYCGTFYIVHPLWKVYDFIWLVYRWASGPQIADWLQNVTGCNGTISPSEIRMGFSNGITHRAFSCSANTSCWNARLQLRSECAIAICRRMSVHLLLLWCRGRCNLFTDSLNFCVTAKLLNILHSLRHLILIVFPYKRA